MPQDLDCRGAIHDLVIHFYREIALDDLLGPFFGEVAEVDWADHIPRLIDYWCRVLLGSPGYDGRILGAHQRVNEIQAFEPDMFERWYRLFVASVDSTWPGRTPRRRNTTRSGCRGSSPAASSANRSRRRRWTRPPRCASASDGTHPRTSEAHVTDRDRP